MTSAASVLIYSEVLQTVVASAVIACLAQVYRLQILRVIFFVPWTTFPMLWLLSSTSACILDENVSACLYLLADAMCKNSYGIVLWSTTWGLLNGKWDREYPRNRDENGVLMEVDPDAKEVPEEAQPQNYDIKFLGQTIASVKRSQRRPREDMEAKDQIDSRIFRESK
jgi:bacteriorhodopsin